MKKKILIVGEDSRIAKFLITYLKKKKLKIISTTRRMKKLSSSKVFLNLSRVENFEIPKNVSEAVILAGVDGNKNCLKDYKYSYKINCISIPKLILKLIKKNIFVCYLSTSAVFDNKKNLSKENSKQYSKSAYGRLKLIAEKKILNFVNKCKKKKNLSILRVTKNVDIFSEPFCDWIKKINKKKIFSASKHFYFAPVTFDDTKKIIFKILKKRSYGIFHFSGERDISYFYFAKRLLSFNKINADLVDSNYSLNNIHRPSQINFVTALNMNRSSKNLKIKATPIKKIIKLFSNNIS